MSLTILCDLDGIVVDLVEKWLRLYNKDHGTDFKREFQLHWDFHNCVPSESKKVYEYFNEPGFFADLAPLPGAIETLQAITEMGHEVIIVSAPTWPGTAACDKVDWVRTHLPFIHKRSMFLGHKKHLLRGDILIDDSPSNIEAYRKAWPLSRIMTIAYEYNRKSESLVDVYAQNYLDTVKAWHTIRDAIVNFNFRG